MEQVENAYGIRPKSIVTSSKTHTGIQDLLEYVYKLRVRYDELRQRMRSVNAQVTFTGDEEREDAPRIVKEEVEESDEYKRFMKGWKPETVSGYYVPMLRSMK